MRKLICLLCAATAALAWPGLASAHRARVGVGVYFGPGFYYPQPYYYPPPVYYPQPPVVIQQQAPVYIEQTPTVTPVPQAQPAQASSDWFYCASSKTYYPYTKDCPEPWQRVSPVPPSIQGR